MRVSGLCSCCQALGVCFTARSTARSTAGATARSTTRQLQAPSTAPADSVKTCFKFRDDLVVTGPYDTDHSPPQTVTYMNSEAQIDFSPENEEDEAPCTIRVNWEGQVHKCSRPHKAGQTGSLCQDYLFSPALGRILAINVLDKYVKTDGIYMDRKMITDWMAQSLTDPQVTTEWMDQSQGDCPHSKTPLQEMVAVHNFIGEITKDGAELTAKHPSPDAKFSTMTITLDDEIWLLAHPETAAGE